MKLSDFDYILPKELIAQHPLEERDHSKLMVLDRGTKSISHHRFFELPELLDPNSVVVFNESRVIPARLKFHIGFFGGEINANINNTLGRLEIMGNIGRARRTIHPADFERYFVNHMINLMVIFLLYCPNQDF